MISLSLLCLLFTRQLWLFYIFSVILGFAYGGLATLSPLLEAEFFGLAALGMIAGAVNFVGTIGEAVGPILAGKIFDGTRSYQPAFLLCLGLSISSVILAFWLKRAR
jgi:MFS family permease